MVATVSTFPFYFFVWEQFCSCNLPGQFYLSRLFLSQSLVVQIFLILLPAMPLLLLCRASNSIFMFQFSIASVIWALSLKVNKFKGQQPWCPLTWRYNYDLGGDDEALRRSFNLLFWHDCVYIFWPSPGDDNCLRAQHLRHPKWTFLTIKSHDQGKKFIKMQSKKVK